MELTAYKTILNGVFRNVKIESGWDVNILAAQIALETGWLDKVLTGTNNLFNIKYSGAGKIEKESEEKNKIKINKKTFSKVKEYIKGQPVYINATFRAYEKIEDSVKDYIDFVNWLTKGEIQKYKKNPEEYYKCLQSHGYATDPNYVNLLMSIYKKISNK